MYYNSLNNYLNKRFGEKLYKLALDGSMSCPNRDGTLSSAGCVFCLGGSGAFAEKNVSGVSQQIESAKKRLAGKSRSSRFIAYFQSGTNTYAPAAYLRALFSEIIAREDIAVLSIGTRPDCLPPETVALLGELNRIKPVWVELGLQSSSDETAKRINRCYETSVYSDAVRRLNSVGIDVITHIILGLPGESREQMLKSAVFAARSGSAGIKLQLLHVLRETSLAKSYERGEFSVFERDEYLELVTDILELLPPDMVIHRLTGDGAKSALIAPLWSADKKAVLNELRRVMIRKDTTQGRLWQS